MSEIMTVKECADFLRVEPQWVRKRIKAGKIPFHRLAKNGKILFRRSEVLEWFDRFKNNSSSEEVKAGNGII